MDLTPPYRFAIPEDAQPIAELVNMAGSDMGRYIWATLARPGQTAWDVGFERARLGLGGFAHHNVVVREVEGRVAACLIGYRPESITTGPADKPHPILAPLVELGHLVTNNWFLNVIATFPDFRGRGFGSELLAIADRRAREASCERISLTMSDANHVARRLYERHGYSERASRPIFKDNWKHAGEHWLLMVKEL
ncbi:MAG: GNAT family N-acetyltransferase [Phycisphaerales bacterium]|nr:GNAT family N-acetyltransferase [Phycisphaerales bacterium]